jgi:NADH:ubiquinone oxidoreductase subunit 6 (subunit J)
MPLLIKVVVLAALGGAGIYLLLPKPRHHSVLVGGVLALLALLALGVLLSPVSPSLETLLFSLFSAVAVISGCLLITQRNPARAALSFALVVVSTCGLFLLQAAPFLLAATVIIYAGAIIVTFLFVLMLAQQEGPSDADARSREPLWSAFAGAGLLATLLYVLGSTYNPEGLTTLDERLERVSRAAQALPEQPAAGGADLAEVQNALKELREWVDAHAADLDTRGEARPAPLPDNGKRLSDRITEAYQVSQEKPVPWDKLKQALRDVRVSGLAVRHGLGSLQVPDEIPLAGKSEGVPLSGYSGPPANERPESLRRDAEGRPQLPAANTGHLGRSLFTDYLLPVELGGTLLLVATIGAIAIASRSAERLS